MGEILRLENISKSFPGVKALDRVSFSINEKHIHSIVGENGAGKSTLIKIIGGVHQQDEGKIFLNGEEIFFHNPLYSISEGITIVYQELNLVEQLTAADNLFLGIEEEFVIRNKNDYSRAKQILENLQIDIDPSTTVQNLPIGKKQLLEIAKASFKKPKILIMDEPTSSLSSVEIDILFNLIRNLKEEGTTIIYISHKLDEVLELSDMITVLRDGNHIDTGQAKNYDGNKLIKLMVNRDMSEVFPSREPSIEEPVLEVKDLTKKGVFSNCSFTLNKGEILGFYGLMGAGRTELFQSIFGVEDFDSGEIIINGKPFSDINPKIAKSSGIGFITEDRRSSGIVSCRGTHENMTLPNMEKITKANFVIDDKKEQENVNVYKNRLDIKFADMKQLIKYLSGGNQQKVIIAKWLMAHPQILIMDEPTRGIDVGAKREIYELINELSLQGISIIFISSEIEEILGLSDRIIIMRSGEIKDILIRDEKDATRIAEIAFGR